MKFRRGLAGLADLDRPRSTGTFEVGFLPDAEKERLARSLLDEFGADRVQVGGDGEELIHGCLLPFGNHSDQDANPTASLNWKKLTYNCFGCGAGGGLIWFIGLCRDETGEKARQWLEEQTGTGADEQSLSSLLEYFDAVYSKERTTTAPLPRMDAKVLDQWKFIHPYLTEIRHIPEQNIIDATVGYGSLRVRLGADQFVDSERIIIPHFWKGTLVGWQSRRLLKGDGTPKYLSTPDFPKDSTIFRFDQRAETTVVVESPMSVISKMHLGSIEATFGAEVTDRQIRLLSIHRKVILFMDNDEAGWNATRRLGDALEAYSTVWVAENPYAADPADLDDATYEALVADPTPYALWSPPTRLEEWKRP